MAAAEDTRPLVLFGASGHAKVVFDAVRRGGRFKVVFFADDSELLRGGSFLGLPVVVGRDDLRARARDRLVTHAIVTIGDNRVRSQIADWLESAGLELACALHPAAVIDPTANIGRGTVVMAGAVINADVRIGRNVIVNTGATVDHDCQLDDGVHVAPGAHLCGNVTLGRGAFAGAGSTFVPGVRIGAGAVIGAGATVLEDVPADARVAGTPARPIRSRKSCA